MTLTLGQTGKRYRQCSSTKTSVFYLWLSFASKYVVCNIGESIVVSRLAAMLFI